MLVLTRRPKDRISFPQLGISVHFLRIGSGQAKVGIDAPPEIMIVREGHESEEITPAVLQRQLNRLPKQIRHGIRNELHQVSVGVHLLKELSAQGLDDEAGDVFKTIQSSLERISECDAICAPSAGKQKHDPLTIALVEDQPNEREMLASLLRMQRHNVNTFEDGSKVIEHFRSDPPDVLLIDMQMPRCDGAFTIRQLRDQKLLGNTAVHVISGTSPHAFELQSGRDAVDRWFSKPLNPQKLFEQLSIDSANRKMPC